MSPGFPHLAAVGTGGATCVVAYEGAVEIEHIHSGTLSVNRPLRSARSTPYMQQAQPAANPLPRNADVERWYARTRVVALPRQGPCVAAFGGEERCHGPTDHCLLPGIDRRSGSLGTWLRGAAGSSPSSRRSRPARTPTLSIAGHSLPQPSRRRGAANARSWWPSSTGSAGTFISSRG